MRAFVCFSALCFLVMTSVAQDNTAVFVAEKFAAFEEIMHSSWEMPNPGSNNADIIFLGPRCEAAFVQIEAVDPFIPNQARLIHYMALRKEMGHLVAQFVSACRANNGGAAKGVLLKLRPVFEDARAQLHPIKFELLDSSIVVADAVIDKYIPATDWDELKKSTHNLQTKLDHIDVSSFPIEVEPYQDKLTAEFANAALVSREMAACVEKKDLPTLKARVTALRGMLVSIRDKYL